MPSGSTASAEHALGEDVVGLEREVRVLARSSRREGRSGRRSRGTPRPRPVQVADPHAAASLRSACCSSCGRGAEAKGRFVDGDHRITCGPTAEAPRLRRAAGRAGRTPSSTGPPANSRSSRRVSLARIGSSSAGVSSRSPSRQKTFAVGASTTVPSCATSSASSATGGDRRVPRRPCLGVAVDFALARARPTSGRSPAAGRARGDFELLRRPGPQVATALRPVQ